MSHTKGHRSELGLANIETPSLAIDMRVEAIFSHVSVPFMYKLPCYLVQGLCLKPAVLLHLQICKHYVFHRWLTNSVQQSGCTNIVVVVINEIMTEELDLNRLFKYLFIVALNYVLTFHDLHWSILGIMWCDDKAFLLCFLQEEGET